MTENNTKRTDSMTDAEARELAETHLKESLQDNRYLMERSLQLLQIQRKISSRLSLNDVLDSIIYSVVDLLNVDAAEVLLLEPGGRRLTSRATAMIEPNPTGTQVSIADRSIVERVIRDRNSIAIGDTENEPEQQVSILLGVKPVRALASFPMKIEKNIIGVLNVYSLRPINFTDVDLADPRYVLGRRCGGRVEREALYGHRPRKEAPSDGAGHCSIWTYSGGRT